MSNLEDKLKELKESGIEHDKNVSKKSIKNILIVFSIILFLGLIYEFVYPQYSKCECYDSYVLRDLGRNPDLVYIQRMPDFVKAKDRWCLRSYSIEEIRGFASEWDKIKNSSC